MCCIVYTIVVDFPLLSSPLYSLFIVCLKPFSDRSRPNEHAAANRMSKFEIVRFLWLVEIRDFELCDRVLLLLLRTTETLAPASALTIGRSSMKFGMQLHYGNASGCIQAFFKKFNFRWFLPFFLEKTWFLLYETLAPASALTIHRSSMKFGMELYYGNASGCFQAFFKKFNFRRFLPFFI